MLRKYQRRTAGPGRPRKYPEGIKFFGANIAGSTYDRLYALKESLGVPFSELLTWLVDLAEGKIDKLKLLAKTRHQEEYIKQLEKEKQALQEELERERIAREKAEKEAEYWKQQYYELKDKMKGKAAVSSRSTKIINALVKVIEEGKTFADTMIEIGIEHPQEQLAILRDLFITKDEYGNIASVFYPLKTLKKLQGWVLVKGKEPGMLNYVWSREETLKVAQQLKKVKAQFVIKVKEDIEERLSNWADIYERFLSRDPNAASEYLLKILNKGLPELIKEYSFETVEEVILSNPRFSEIFGSLLPSLKKKVVLEVKANV